MFGRKKYKGKVFTTHKRFTRIKYVSHPFTGSNKKYVQPRSAKAGHNRGDNRRWANKMRAKYGGD